jgi:hypothetical protein
MTETHVVATEINRFTLVALVYLIKYCCVDSLTFAVNYNTQQDAYNDDSLRFYLVSSDEFLNSTLRSTNFSPTPDFPFAWRRKRISSSVHVSPWTLAKKEKKKTEDNVVTVLKKKYNVDLFYIILTYLIINKCLIKFDIKIQVNTGLPTASWNYGKYYIYNIYQYET